MGRPRRARPQPSGAPIDSYHLAQGARCCDRTQGEEIDIASYGSVTELEELESGHQTMLMMDFYADDGWFLPEAIETEYLTPDGVNPFWYDPCEGCQSGSHECEPAVMVPYDKRLSPHDWVNRWTHFISQPALDRLESSVAGKESESESDTESLVDPSQNHHSSVWEHIPELSRCLSNHVTPLPGLPDENS